MTENAANANRGQSDVVFVLLPGVVLLDVAGPAEAFRLAERLVPGTFRLRYAGVDRRVESAPGLVLAALEPLPKRLKPGSLVVIAGVTGNAEFLGRPETKRVVEWLRATSFEGQQLMCVCAGSLVAAAAGLLEGRECTTHYSHIEHLKKLAPTARVLDNRIFVESDHISTSAGVTAGLDLALHRVADRLGPPVAAEVARDLVVYQRRAGADPALSAWVKHRNHIHPVVHRVQDAVVRRPDSEWSAEDLARAGFTSPRNLTRLFAEHAGCSPLDYVQSIRIAVARELVAHTELDLENVAHKAGFTSAQQLRRAWRRWDPRPPREARAATR